ncbi:hypothetical protein DCC85_02270 [Paenibacillus sp. CAA11]|uniref:hypothetical protein n=1 Tax=Paenibacillus sp. CAA11 TaxID=1532905 RepID=UPI000D3A546F|nr:hypothetical protein [Paenibacillus sp. CAA11]AWB43172.1 hypothetical protein DCC85_02270 [Paenibacillus sp. CAA11]
MKDKRPSKLKRVMLILFILFAFFLLEQIPAIQKITALSSSRIYVFMMYRDDGLTFKDIEYVPEFGDYFVSYQNRNGESLSFIVSPKFFPVFISYDPIKKEAFLPEHLQEECLFA